MRLDLCLMVADVVEFVDSPFNLEFTLIVGISSRNLYLKKSVPSKMVLLAKRDTGSLMRAAMELDDQLFDLIFEDATSEVFLH